MRLGGGKAGRVSPDSLGPAGLALPQEKEMEKQRLLYQQARLHTRGAAEMVLQMISACKGALMRALLPSTRTLSPHPQPPTSRGPRAHSPTLHACGVHTSAHTSRLPRSGSPLPAPGMPLHPFSHVPRDCCFLVGGEQRPKTERTIFCPPPPRYPPPGETGAMVSSTLKLGISILNGGNADVQQVTRERAWEEG